MAIVLANIRQPSQTAAMPEAAGDTFPDAAVLAVGAALAAVVVGAVAAVAWPGRR